MRTEKQGPEIAVALDVPVASEALALVDRIGPEAAAWKVGLELFTAEGPDLVRAIVGRGGAVFLDLKLYDIPNTVGRAVSTANTLGVRWLTVHATGGPSMLRAAAEAAADDLRILAVTILTSLGADETAEILGREGADPGAEAVRLARMAEGAGVSGFVCSGEETARLRAALDPAAYLVTPGIRPAGSARGDQVRVTTPTDALRSGSDLLVIGRPITRAADPVQALAEVRTELDGARAGSGVGE